MRAEKIKTMSVSELQKELIVKKAKLHTYMLDLKSGKEKDTAKVKHMRKDIARILTWLNFKNLASEVTAALAEVEAEKKPVKETNEDKEVKEVTKAETK